MVRNRKPNFKFLRVFGALCYPTNDSEDLGKMKPKANIAIFNGFFNINFKHSPSVVSPNVFAATPSQDTVGETSSTTIDQDAPFPSQTGWIWGVLTNKIRLVAKGYGNEERIDFKELFASIGRIKAIRIFIAYAAHKNIMVYQIFVNTSFLNEALRAWYDMLSKFLPSQKFYKGTVDLTLVTRKEGKDMNLSKYALEMLKKYGLESCDTVNTSMVERSKLSKDPQGTQVDPTRYQNYGFNCNKISLYRDSKSVIDLSCNTIHHSRTKHIAVHYHFIKEQVENEVVDLYFVNTAYQLAYIFTKALESKRFKFLLNHLGMQSITPEKLKSLVESDEE
nr:ribonuclease H [Tanacetum cinerariifolium]